MGLVFVCFKHLSMGGCFMVQKAKRLGETSWMEHSQFVHKNGEELAMLLGNRGVYTCMIHKL